MVQKAGRVDENAEEKEEEQEGKAEEEDETLEEEEEETLENDPYTEDADDDGDCCQDHDLAKKFGLALPDSAQPTPALPEPSKPSATKQPPPVPSLPNAAASGQVQQPLAYDEGIGRAERLAKIALLKPFDSTQNSVSDILDTCTMQPSTFCNPRQAIAARKSASAATQPPAGTTSRVREVAC